MEEPPRKRRKKDLKHILHPASYEDDPRLYGSTSNEGGRSRSYAREHFPTSRSVRKYPISFKILENLLKREPYIIPVELLKKNSGYDVFLNENIRDDKMTIVLKLLFMSLESRASHEEVKSLISLTFTNTNFIQCLTQYVCSVMNDAECAIEILPKIGALAQRFLTNSPLIAFKILSPLIHLCISAIQHIKKKDETLNTNVMEKLYEEIQLEVEEKENYWNKGKETKKQIIYGEPPESIKAILPFPTVEELHDEKRPFLRPNIVEGHYENSQHYLDVQFRLLKEDFVRPLREGLRSYRKDTNFKPQDVRIYAKVKLQDTGVEHSELVYFLKLDTPKKFNLENSKRLMYGNILCVSSDNFTTMIICSLLNRNKIKDNLIGVKIESEGADLKYDESYTILESKAYFVAYKHTLKALQNMDDVPLFNYLVKVDENIFLPSYVNDQTFYKLCMCNRKLCGCDSVQVNNLDSWPSSNELDMDESQRRALHGALSRQMAIIQGPPGTGKTFIGLRITQILLKNQLYWNVNKNPILVVCYTNHALDQFLEGILKFTGNIVRVGSRSKVEALQHYQINRKLFTKGSSSLDKRSVENRYFQVKKNIKEVQLDIDRLTDDIDRLSMPGIISISSFMPFKIIPAEFRKREIDFTGYLIDNTCIGYWDPCSFDFNFPVPHYNNENEDFSVEEELRGEEEVNRLLDDEDFDDFSSEEHAPFGLTFLVNPVWHAKDIKKLNGEINIFVNKHGYEPAALASQRTRLMLELENVKRGHLILGNKRKCQLLEKMPLHQLEFDERWMLYNFWKSQFRQKLIEQKKYFEKNHKELNKSLHSMKDLAYLHTMKNVDVVGMTTTGAAQHCNILHDLAPPIVIVEEAAEIMESHVVSALSTKCQHLILIGDHLQLRPKANVYDLEKNYNLSISLFERMIKNKITHFVLEYQHRMKPIFSELLVPSIYKDLKDHPSVQDFPEIKGVSKALFFVDHTEMESKPYEQSESVENVHEAEFMMGLCRHLIFQGYEKEDITILTPYSGQYTCLRKIQKKLEFHHCEGVRIAILDNYQGEESNIILLSLVRSNAEEKVGFVKSENRVCVALSRARHGMYIIGNMSQIVKSSDLWGQIREKLVSKGHLGIELELRCTNHPDVSLHVKTLNDFDKECPQGGCTRPCSFVFPNCEHSCNQSCHAIDMNHKNFKCRQKCSKFCDRGHPCRELCYKKCPSCDIIVEKTLPCSHIHMVPCGVDDKTFPCPTMVERTLVCGHNKRLECNMDYELARCDEPCSARLDCGHQCLNKCHVLKDPTHEEYLCPKPCERKSVGCNSDHRCNKKCYENCDQCTKIVIRQLKCGHTKRRVKCGAPEEKLVCFSKCEKYLPCGHICTKKCGDACGDCFVKVDKMIDECSHVVEIECSKKPTRYDCKENCEKKMDCGHRCRNKCKLPCSSCEERVASKYKCPRGHVVHLPCQVVRSDVKFNMSSSALDENIVGRYCNEPCNTPLQCGHICKGKCGDCYNGRLHKACLHPCGKVLVCGHVCKYPCGSVCPPCLRKCFWKCSHSECKKKCGIPCINCQERCIRKCPHSKCTKKCGEKCDRDQCDQPCNRKLKCGHPCIGYCGETCPELCRECDREKVTAIFFGTEDEPDARFVVLEDCKHVFEASGLKNWLSSKISDADEIGMKVCPSCRSPIYNTRRFHNEILSRYADVLLVKMQSFTSKFDGNIDELRSKIDSFQNIWPVQAKDLRVRLRGHQNFIKYKLLNDKEMEGYLFQLNFLVSAKNVYEKFGEGKKILEGLIKRVFRSTTRMSGQEMDEMSSELQRLEISISVEKSRTLASRDPKIPNLLGTIDVHMDPSIKFNSEAKTEVVKLLKEIEKYAGPLGISESEKIQIVRAMGLRQGHWYKCPKGHIYCITECGGAVVESNCPECGATIGGQSHRLRGDNALANEMDGAVNPAWPTALRR